MFGPSIGERIDAAKDNAEAARSTYRGFHTGAAPNVPKANNVDPLLATNWETILSNTTPVMAAGEYTLLPQWIWHLDSSNRQGWFRAYVDGVALDPVKLKVADADDERADNLIILPDYFSDWSTDTTHTIEFKALISTGGGNPTMTITSEFFLLSRTG